MHEHTLKQFFDIYNITSTSTTPVYPEYIITIYY